MTRMDGITLDSNLFFDDPTFPVAVRRYPGAVKPPASVMPLQQNHRHGFAELILVTSGSVTLSIDGHDYLLIFGDVLVIRADSSHRIVPQKDTALLQICFIPKRLPLPLDWLRRLPGYNVIFEVGPAVRGAQTFKHHLTLNNADLTSIAGQAELLENNLIDATPGAQLGAFSNLLNLIVALSRRYESPHPGSRATPIRIAKVISLLEIEFARDWTLPELAHIAALSGNSLLRTFKQATGTSPIDYLLRVRLRRAAEMLRTGDVKVAEAAKRCGFTDANNFSRRFKKEYGVAPAHWRV